jgi:hypothetical protein
MGWPSAPLSRGPDGLEFWLQGTMLKVLKKARLGELSGLVNIQSCRWMFYQGLFKINVIHTT